MSKRAGTVITLDDLVERIGIDAARYALIRSSVDSTLDIDMDLWASRILRQSGLLRAVRACALALHRPESRRCWVGAC